jgi:hypothetical protein
MHATDSAWREYPGEGGRFGLSVLPETRLHRLSAAPVLVAEDDYVIGEELTAALNRQGLRVLGPVATVEGALVLLDVECPAAAILDHRLRDELATPVDL